MKRSTNNTSKPSPLDYLPAVQRLNKQLEHKVLQKGNPIESAYFKKLLTQKQVQVEEESFDSIDLSAESDIRLGLHKLEVVQEERTN